MIIGALHLFQVLIHLVVPTFQAPRNEAELFTAFILRSAYVIHHEL